MFLLFKGILLAYIILSAVSIFAGGYYYHNINQKRRDERKLYFPKLASKRKLSTHQVNLLISKKISLKIKLIWFSCVILLFSYLYAHFLYSLQPIVYFSYLITLEIFYWELFLINHAVKRNISTKSRQIYTTQTLHKQELNSMLKCPNNYKICEYYKSKSPCNCMKENCPGECVRKQELLKRTRE